MKAGGWPSIILIYLFGVLAVASLSKLIPLADAFEQSLGASPQQFALLLSLLAVPAAVLGAVVGGFVDRIGAGRALVLSALAGALANLMYFFAQPIGTFQMIRVFEGFSMVGVFASAPALLMATTADKRRVRAMALWSTYTPVGFSAGLVMSGAFVGTPHWRGSFAVHGSLFVALALAGLMLPTIARKPVDKAESTVTVRVRQLFAAYGQVKPLRLALAFGAIASIGLGTSTIFPAYFSHEHQLAVGTASNILAGANLAMVAGSALAGALVSRGIRVRSLFAAIALTGTVAGAAIYFPGTPLNAGLVALCVWLATTGAANATVLAVLPRVIADTQRGASAAGLISQMGALVAFVTPPIWLPLLANGGWTPFVALVIAGWLASFLLLPVRNSGVSMTEAAASR